MREILRSELQIFTYLIQCNKMFYYGSVTEQWTCDNDEEICNGRSNTSLLVLDVKGLRGRLKLKRLPFWNLFEICTFPPSGNKRSLPKLVYITVDTFHMYSLCFRITSELLQTTSEHLTLSTTLETLIGTISIFYRPIRRLLVDGPTKSYSTIY